MFVPGFVGFEFKIRPKGRRLVMGLVVDHELQLTEIRVRQLHQVVDIFVILESNITAGKLFVSSQQKYIKVLFKFIWCETLLFLLLIYTSPSKTIIFCLSLFYTIHQVCKAHYRNDCLTPIPFSVLKTHSTTSSRKS